MSDEKQAGTFDKGPAPRVTDADIDAAIRTRQFWNPFGTTLTVCVLTLQNGFNVVGESACVSPENFDLDLGQQIAFRKARDKIWALEGYLLAAALRPTVDHALHTP